MQNKERPGIIDVKSLLEIDGKLKLNLVCGAHYHVLNQKQWEFLKNHYATNGEIFKNSREIYDNTAINSNSPQVDLKKLKENAPDIQDTQEKKSNSKQKNDIKTNKDKGEIKIKEKVGKEVRFLSDFPTNSQGIENNLDNNFKRSQTSLKKDSYDSVSPIPIQRINIKDIEIIQKSSKEIISKNIYDLPARASKLKESEQIREIERAKTIGKISIKEQENEKELKNKNDKRSISPINLRPMSSLKNSEITSNKQLQSTQPSFLCRPFGLENPKFQCYLNSVLQCIISLQEFSYYILSKKSSKRILNSFSSLLKNAKASDIQSAQAISSLFQKSFPSHKQHDAPEFLRIFIDRINTELGENTKKSNKNTP